MFYGQECGSPVIKDEDVGSVRAAQQFGVGSTAAPRDSCSDWKGR